MARKNNKNSRRADQKVTNELTKTTTQNSTVTESKQLTVNKSPSTNSNANKIKEDKPVLQIQKKDNNDISEIELAIQPTKPTTRKKFNIFNNTLSLLKSALKKKADIIDNNNPKVKKLATETKLFNNDHYDKIITRFIETLISHTNDNTALNNLLRLATTQTADPSAKKTLLEKLNNLNFVHHNGCSFLHYAATQGDIKKVEALVKNGAKVDIQDEHGNTPLHGAVILKRTDVIKLLIEKGANVNAKNEHGNTALHFAADSGDQETVKLLLEKGADVNAKDEHGNTAAHFAADSGDQETVKLLLEKGADVSITNEEKSTVLDCAINRTEETIRNIDSMAQTQETVLTSDEKCKLTLEITKQKKNWQQKILSLLSVTKQLASQEATAAKFNPEEIDKISAATNLWNCDEPNAIEGSKILELWNNLIGEGARGDSSDEIGELLDLPLGETTQVEQI